MGMLSAGRWREQAGQGASGARNPRQSWPGSGDRVSAAAAGDGRGPRAGGRGGLGDVPPG
eukprot:642231-Rhodomonas_salina.2